MFAGRAMLIFVLFALLYGVGQFHRVATGVVVTEIERELAFGADTLAAISAVLFLAAALVQVPVGVLLDRYGPRRTVPTLLVLAVIGTLTFALAHTAPGLILGRILLGVGYGAVLMGGFVIFARWVPPDRFATASSMMIACGSFGGLLATSPLAALVELVGWRSTFVGVAALTGLLAVLVATFVRDAPPGYRETGARPATLVASLRGLLDVLRKRQMRYILAMALVGYGSGMTVLGLWGGPFLSDLFGLDAIARGHVLFVMALAGPVAVAVVGPLDRRFNTRKWIVLALGAGQVLVLSALALFGGTSLAVAVVGLVLIMVTQSFNVTLAAHCRAVFPDHLVGRANTMVNMAAIAGVAIMQYTTGLIIEAFPAETGIADPLAYRLLFGMLALMVAAAALVYARVEDAPPFADRARRQGVEQT